MHTILIAGAGQLGSRHLQGLKKSSNELDIWVFDLSEESLRIAEERYNQVETTNHKTAHFVQSLNDVPIEIDVAIVASGSKPRLTICKELLKHSKVKYLVLEKFLFTSLKEYDEADTLFRENNVRVWVNCPRRMFAYYDRIRDILNGAEKVSMEFVGKDWGMCCNSIHFVDIFMKLCNENKFVIDCSAVDPKVVESKRVGYIEFYGTEVITTPNGNQLKLTCLQDYSDENVIVIKKSSTEIRLYEGQQKMFVNGVEEPANIRYQSQLTGEVVDSLISTGNCALTTYSESAEFHKTYLKSILSLYNIATGEEHDSCPIT